MTDPGQKENGHRRNPELNSSLRIEKTENGFQITWDDHEEGEYHSKIATPEELLAIKLAAEDMSPREAARSQNAPCSTINHILHQVARKGIIRLPAGLIIRDEEVFSPDGHTPISLLSAETFTLQWHITNACDLRCKHCYDRSDRSPLTLSQGMDILDQLRDFCRSRYVKGHVCFTGGNPFMYPHFFALYEAAVKKGLSTSVLGNPVAENMMNRLAAIQKPEYFQVSLEGLKAHTDYIRGSGYFERVINFIEVLRKHDISSAVMLTLTRKNIDEVIPLARVLKGKTDHFTFNRLSLVGEGAHLQLPEKERYEQFLAEYVEIFKDDGYVGYKDNLINTILMHKGMKTFDGCTGFGCGAAFNFVAVLPDGEVHACRKFPSLLGNILDTRLDKLYDSETAQQYRRGSQQCRGCRLRSRCGGCLAVAYSHGRDIFREKDPFCFIKDNPECMESVKE